MPFSMTLNYLNCTFIFAILTKRDGLYEGLLNAIIGMIAAAATYAVGYGISLLQI